MISKRVVEGTAIAFLVLVVGIGFIVTRFIHPTTTMSPKTACKSATEINATGLKTPKSHLHSAVTVAQADLTRDRDAYSYGAFLEFISPANAMPSAVRPDAETFYRYVAQFARDKPHPHTIGRTAAQSAAQKLDSYWAKCKSTAGH